MQYRIVDEAAAMELDQFKSTCLEHRQRGREMFTPHIYEMAFLFAHPARDVGSPAVLLK